MQNKKSEPTSSNRKIVIGLCTFLRNQMLDGALESLLRMDLPTDVSVELVLVDNDPNGGARDLFEYYHAIFPFNSYYFIEPKQGVVYARNRVIDEALKLEATEIAFIDDDEIVSEQWLTALWNFYRDSFFTGVCGPMYRLLPPETDQVLLKFWQNYQQYKTGEERVMYCNNCLFSTNIVRPDKMNIRFDEFFNQIGGEDSMFSLNAINQGARFAHVSEAITIERFSKTRATFGYLLRRHFGSGSLLPIALKRAYSRKVWRLFLSHFPRLIVHAIFAPFAILFGRYKFWKNLVKLSEDAGVITGCFGKSYKHYIPKNILKESQV